MPPTSLSPDIGSVANATCSGAQRPPQRPGPAGRPPSAAPAHRLRLALGIHCAEQAVNEEIEEIVLNDFLAQLRTCAVPLAIA